jgi:pimeloyl-ACP methyl ester carboxylesterase
VLVPGAWHRPAHLEALVAELRGIDTHTVALPSTGNDPANLGDMYADAAAIAAAVAAVGGPTVVLAHSYGGIPTTQGLRGARNARRIVYLAAFQLDYGESLFSVSGGAPMPWSPVHQSATGSYLDVADPVDVFYADVDPVTADRAVRRLGHLSYAVGHQAVTEVAWKEVPSTYVICEADNALPPAVQEQFAKRADEVRRIDTSHSPFLSRPAELARLIEDVLAHS